MLCPAASRSRPMDRALGRRRGAHGSRRPPGTWQSPIRGATLRGRPPDRPSGSTGLSSAQLNTPVSPREVACWVEASWGAGAG